MEVEKDGSGVRIERANRDKEECDWMRQGKYEECTR